MTAGSSLPPPAEAASGSKGGRLSVSAGVFVSFTDSGALLVDARTRRRLKANSHALLVLAAVADGSGEERDRLEQTFGAEPVQEALAELQAAGLLSEEPARTVWGDWGPLPWLLHRLSNDVPYMPTERTADAYEALARDQPPPPSIYACRCQSSELTVDLPKPRSSLRAPLGEVLLSRRTCRAFTDQAISIEQLSDLLFYTGGWLYCEQVEHVGPALKKCAPSPGARHSVEIYPLITNCLGVPPAVYHYCVQHHRLARTATPDPGPFAHEALARQEYFSSAPVVFLFTCVPGRMMWKYKTPRAYRHVHIEVGHYCQNLVLCATALGLGCFQNGAINDTLIERTLGIDGESEFAIYTAGAGHAAAADPADGDEIQVSPQLAQLLNQPAGT